MNDLRRLSPLDIRWRGIARWSDRLRARSGLTPSEIEELTRCAGTTRTIEKGGSVFGSQECPLVVSLVIDGIAARCVDDRSGYRHLTSIHLPGEMLNLATILIPSQPCGSTALTPLRVVDFCVRSLRAMLEAHPNIVNALWRESCIEAAGSTEWFSRNARLSSTERLAHLLCELSMRSYSEGQRSLRFVLGATQEAVGQVLGITPVHTNRSVRALRDAGLISWEKAVVGIKKWPELAYVAFFDAGYLHLKNVVAH